MTHSFYTLALFCTISFSAFSQEFKRKSFDYPKLEKNTAACDSSIRPEVEAAGTAIDYNNSTLALDISKKLYGKYPNCYEACDIYGYSLFRSGQLMEGVDAIDRGIETFGSVPLLIKTRYLMSLELFEVGTNQKNIDGSTVYLPEKDHLPYTEEQFKEENLQAAVSDLEYLTGKFPEEHKEIFLLARIYQVQKKYELSNKNLQKILYVEEYADNAAFIMSQNHIATKNYEAADVLLQKLLADHPNEPDIYKQLAELNEQKGDTKLQEEYNKKAAFYGTMPYFSGIAFNDTNYDVLRFFGSDENNGKKKAAKLKALGKTENADYVTDMCLAILKMHANHGNGLEEQATDMLVKIGKPAIEKTHALFRSDVSTCTITNLSRIMASVKDESSFELFVEYLPAVANMPMTLIPPAVPEYLVKYDEEKGTKEVLKMIKTFLQEKTSDSSDPMAQLSGFGRYVFYLPLTKIDQKKIDAFTTELGYSDAEKKLLAEKIKIYK